MSKKAKLIALLIFRVCTLLLYSLLFAVGYSLFKTWGGFGGWFVFGFVTVFTMPFDFISNVIKGANDGAKQGANTYKIRDWGNGFTISNNTAGGTITGIITSILACILVGPFTLGCKIIGSFGTIIMCIMDLRAINANNH